MAKGRNAVRTTLATILVVSMVTILAPAAIADVPGSCDFNGDGYDDAPLGIPHRSVPLSTHQSGALHVIYGSSAGLSADGDRQFSQMTAGIANSPHPGDRFGSTFACGDFDGDGYGDLAIGVPQEDRKGVMDVGVVHVLYGSSDGLGTDGASFLHRDAPGVKGPSGAADLFGRALAAGDFDGDGRDDLAVSVLDDRGGHLYAGSVQVFYGSSHGVSTSGDQIWHRALPEIKGEAETDGAFGEAIASADINGDGRDDLIAGAPWDDIGHKSQAGSISVIFGSESGLTGEGNQLIHRNKSGIRNHSRPFDRFGSTLAVGDFDGDGFVDVSVGVPRDSVNGIHEAGSIHVIRGGPNGLRQAGDRVIHRNTPGVQGKAREGDRFGAAMVAGKFNSGVRWDLAVGMRGDEVSALSSAGRVQVIYSGGLVGTRDEFWHQDVEGIASEAKWAELYGASVGTGDFDGDGFADLLAGVPQEGGLFGPSFGSVSVIYGTVDGLSSVGDQRWTLDSPGIVTKARQFDHLGSVVGPTVAS